ncbi:glycosyltransferase [Pseudoflavonifractor sp. MSJ-30]|uniref:glycosyltransferase family 2 protein n=1 Tax=Pseudoflavonifractor sp. MSJ-30 TaxID=2841525 RepID=UPI001C0FDFF5|nr:glycosyltransferase [Pseudoflavonifractor sp. MSJ-30]
MERLNKKVSIIMPVNNASGTIRDAVDSVLRQTYRNYELIIVEDCSEDDSLSIARGYERTDSRIRVIENPVNKGVASSRNTGIRAADGAYIAFLDSDDIWLENKLERQVGLLEKTKAQFTCSSYDFIDEANRPLLRPHLVPDVINYQTILKENIVLCSTVCAEAALLKEHPFRSDYLHEDYVLWLELFRMPIQIKTDRHVLTHYRLMKGSRSHNKLRAAASRWRIYREYLEMDIFRSLFYFLQYSVNGVKKYYL